MADDNDLPGMWSYSDLSGGEADNANDVAQGNYEKPVPVEVKMVVWVDRSAWLEEYACPEEDFEDAVQDWVIEEMQEYGVNGGNWPNVKEVTQ